MRARRPLRQRQMDPAVGDRVEHAVERVGVQVRFEHGEVGRLHDDHRQRATSVGQLDRLIVLGER